MNLVRLEPLSDGVVRLVLARSGMHNALVPELLDALLEALRRIADDKTCRAVVLAADGPAFSIGGDMRRFQRERRGDLHAYAAVLVGKLNEAILALVDLPQPVVAAVHGVVTGGSIGLVLARHGISVHTAKISTLGELVEDTFLISGTELAQTASLVHLEQELLEALRI